MDIENIGAPDFNPGWISRTVMPWDEQAPLITERSPMLLSISTQEPIATLSEWQGIAVHGIYDGGQTTEAIPRLSRWIAVGIPEPSTLSGNSPRPDFFQYTFRSNRRARRQSLNALGIEWPQENGSGEQDRPEMANVPFDLDLPLFGTGENEPDMSHISSPFALANTFAPTIDDMSFARSQPNSVLRDLGSPPVPLPVAVSDQAMRFNEADTLPLERHLTPDYDSATSGERAPLYRSAELALAGAPNPIALTLSRSVQQAIYQEPHQSAERAAHVGGPSRVVNAISSQLTRTVFDEQTLESMPIGNPDQFPVLGSPNAGSVLNWNNGTRNEVHRQGTPPEFMTVRPAPWEQPSQAQNAETGPTQSNAVLSNSASEIQNGIVQSLDQSISSQMRQNRTETATPISLASPAFALLQPARSALSLDILVPTPSFQPSSAVGLTAAPVALTHNENIATSAASVAAILPGNLLSAAQDVVRSVPEVVAARAVAGNVLRDLPAERALAPARVSPQRETDWIRELEDAIQPPATTAQVSYAGVPTPPLMQVVQTASGVASANQSSRNSNPTSVTEGSEATRFSSSMANAGSNAAERAPLGANVVAGGQVASALERSPQSPDVNALAQQVYAILKDRLRAERERHEIYRR